jgi:hypothetical protein
MLNKTTYAHQKLHKVLIDVNNINTLGISRTFSELYVSKQVDNGCTHRW